MEVSPELQQAEAPSWTEQHARPARFSRHTQVSYNVTAVDHVALAMGIYVFWLSLAFLGGT